LISIAAVHASFVGNVCVPDRILGVDADAIRNTITKISPNAPLQEVLWLSASEIVKRIAGFRGIAASSHRFLTP
jgi:hypothetical protein